VAFTHQLQLGDGLEQFLGQVPAPQQGMQMVFVESGVPERRTDDIQGWVTQGLEELLLARGEGPVEPL